MTWPPRLSRQVRDGLLAVLGVAALGVAAFFALHEPPERLIRLRMTAGPQEGTRHRIAQSLRHQAARRALSIELQAAAGSEEALKAVELGLVNVAFVQGGLDMGEHPDLRQVAALHV
jgi:TRAP-type uncharacterized transport system substrate-binding protein